MSVIEQRISARIRIMARTGALAIALTLLVWLIATPLRPLMNGLLIGEVGGAYVVYSMIRHGHHKGELEGRALLASGMLGMFARFVVLIAIMVIALKTKNIINPYTALVGYCLGFVWIFVGFYGIARNRTKQQGGSGM